MIEPIIKQDHKFVSPFLIKFSNPYLEDVANKVMKSIDLALSCHVTLALS